MITPVPFFYLRHGQTDWNRERRCQGHTDIPLNDAGQAQAEAVRDRLRQIDLGIVRIVTSPLGRARRTAEIVNEVLNLPITTLNSLRESGFGEREGTIAGQWHRDWQNGITPPGAEPYQAFAQRAIDAINTALEHPGPVLIVGHGGVYRSMFRHAGVGITDSIPNCVPVRHDPPANGQGAWTATEVTAASDPV